MSLLHNLRRRGLRDILNPKKWKIFARYARLKALRKEYEELTIPEYREQIVYRMTQPGCRECIAKGECVHCGCKSPELFFDKENECSGMFWFEMLEPDSWITYATEQGIETDPFYLEQLDKYGTIKKFKE